MPLIDLSQHSWYFVYAPNSDPKDETSLDAKKADFVEPDESTTAVETEQDIWDDEDEDFDWVERQKREVWGGCWAYRRYK